MTEEKILSFPCFSSPLSLPDLIRQSRKEMFGSRPNMTEKKSPSEEGLF